MENIWSFLMQTLTVSITAAVLLIAKRLFLDKLSPRWQYGVWAILAARLLLPAGLFGRVLIPGLDVVLEAAKTGAESHMASALTDPYGVTEVLTPIPLVRFVRPGSVTDVLFYLYAAGVVVTLLWFFLSYLILRRRVARGSAPSPDALAQVEAVAAQYGLKAPKRITVLPGVESAFVCGPLAPVLVLPAREVDDKVILHELLHLKYGDLWAGVGMCVLRCLHWCNPLLWYCWDRAQNDSEALCDQRVLERLEGEARREYGVILLSMADDRYARSPGTTSMANGGQNIKARISSIARFKRYPKGVGLGSCCVAAVLAIACLAGTVGAVELPGQYASGPLALARARLNRATTPAGALDTYVKALLADSPAYLVMAAPEEELSELLATARTREGLDAPYPLEPLGISEGSGAQADWRVYNLLEGPDGNYTGLLVLDTYSTWFADSYEEGQSIAVSQPVRVFRQGNFWAVKPLEDWAAVDPECTLAVHPTTALPALAYTAQVEDFTIQIDYQYLLGVDNRFNSDGFFTGEAQLDTVPRPDTPFTIYYRSTGGRAWEGGEEVSLAVWYEPLAQGEAFPAEFGRSSLNTPEEYGWGSGGGSDPRGCDHQQAPAAIAVKFQYQDQEYTGIVWPEEVTYD
ncbi:M56 family metallopeptidase [Intestinimonas massiliensis (ex Afouda et al. 2020)]|uniref:M56 family metallopeptidase n=1 Tax=Intestinimonas massiliensis (ex Afouda et al. 2020) TaxID=1673721 RepID=UPI0010315634|nr:M56 family metallopeptidase [Intestinimonas massiliensis (ex Afouda et al. 2020)]